MVITAVIIVHKLYWSEVFNLLKFDHASKKNKKIYHLVLRVYAVDLEIGMAPNMYKFGYNLSLVLITDNETNTVIIVSD